MSGDLMHKGIMELVEAKADTITADDYIPVYQKRTLQVMKVRVGDLISAIARLTLAEAVNIEAEMEKFTSGFAVIKEEEGPIELTRGDETVVVTAKPAEETAEEITQEEVVELEEVQPKPKTRGRKKKNEQS